MNVLLIGAGGREHTIAWKLRQSPRLERLYAIPGNPGIAELAENIAIRADAVPEIVDFALQKKIDLTVVGPELPLSLGICDQFREKGLRIFGPGRAASRIESSKTFSKSLMEKYGIPTARAAAFSSIDEAKNYVRSHPKPCVIKADGLAAGKGVVIAQEESEAFETLESFMGRKSLGEAGSSVLIEEYLEGDEISFIVVTDGETVLPLADAQDHKKIYDGEKGPNTGGMGTYSPVSRLSDPVREEILNRIMIPAVRAMKNEGTPFTGFLFAGLILTPNGVRVLEFNARLGDPETQVILVRLNSDLLDILDRSVDRKLAGIRMQWRREASVCVVLASEGYPQRTGVRVPISGLARYDQFGRDCFVFHAGTEKDGDVLFASGGRILGVTALGMTLVEARQRAYDAVSRIHFSGMQFRKDIGLKGIG